MEFNDFTHLYPISKTLRFELKPIGKTLQNIQKREILKQDEQRAENYQQIKEIIDEYHKAFIDQVLQYNNTKLEALEDYYNAYNDDKREERQKAAEKLRKQIAERFKKDNRFNSLFKDDMFKQTKGKKKNENQNNIFDFINNATEEQLHSLKKEEATKIAESFNGFTTYFSVYYNNRKNMYTADEKSTGIAYRIINQNLPKFIDNLRIFEKIIQIPELQKNITQISTEYSDILKETRIEDIFCLDYYNHLLTQKQIDLYNTIIGGKTP